MMEENEKIVRELSRRKMLGDEWSWEESEGKLAEYHGRAGMEGTFTGCNGRGRAFASGAFSGL